MVDFAAGFEGLQERGQEVGLGLTLQTFIRGRDDVTLVMLKSLSN